MNSFSGPWTEVEEAQAKADEAIERMNRALGITTTTTEDK